MKVRSLLTVGCVLITGTISSATWAHRVNVFAWVDGQQVMTESKFSGGTKVRFGKIVVKDLQTGQELVSGKTDDKGLYNFVVPAEAVKNRHGLLVEIFAGEGHQNSWKIEPDELPTSTEVANDKVQDAAMSTKSEATQTTSTDSTSTSSSTAAAPVTALPATNTDVAAASAVVSSGLTAKEVQAIVDQALDRKLTPIKRTLAEATDKSIKLSDIVGGIGWIFGLFGVAAIVNNRRPKKKDSSDLPA